ncbi:MAG: hypothetical protein GY936_00090 [Ignavibacteriae bacterium]|nr:hypothetical protein [Ignavibacteriota bacterium]
MKNIIILLYLISSSIGIAQLNDIDTSKVSVMIEEKIGSSNNQLLRFVLFTDGQLSYRFLSLEKLIKLSKNEINNINKIIDKYGLDTLPKTLGKGEIIDLSPIITIKYREAQLKELNTIKYYSGSLDDNEHIYLFSDAYSDLFEEFKKIIQNN